MLLLVRTAGSAFRRALEKLFEARRAPAGRPLLQDWLEVALWTAILIIGAVTTPVNPTTGKAHGPGQEWLQAHTGGGICLYRRITGIECPGCGLSRGFVQLEHGDIVAAVKLNPLTPVVFFLMTARLVHYLLICLFRVEVHNRIPWWLAWKLYGIVIAGFALVGVYRVAFRFI